MKTNIEIHESSFASFSEPVGRRYKVRLIEGDRLGSSGYYPAEMLLRDGPKVFKKGTPMYLDHQTPEERDLRPFGSVTTYAGELAEDAYYDNDGLYAEIEVFEHQMPLIKSLKDKIGISIRARGNTVIETINGKSVPVFKELTMARSADFVVKAGAGGKIVQILESATEDSGTDSEATEEGQVMDEATKELFAGLAAGQVALVAGLKELSESFKAIPVAEVADEAEESAVDVLAVANELATSTLSEEGRERVLERFRLADNKKALKELIDAEEAYIKKATPVVSDEGFEESADADSEESAKITLPSVWKKKD